MEIHARDTFAKFLLALRRLASPPSTYSFSARWTVGTERQAGAETTKRTACARLLRSAPSPRSCPSHQPAPGAGDHSAHNAAHGGAASAGCGGCTGHAAGGGPGALRTGAGGPDLGRMIRRWAPVSHQPGQKLPSVPFDDAPGELLGCGGLSQGVLVVALVKQAPQHALQRVLVQMDVQVLHPLAPGLRLVPALARPVPLGTIPSGRHAVEMTRRVRARLNVDEQDHNNHAQENGHRSGPSARAAHLLQLAQPRAAVLGGHLSQLLRAPRAGGRYCLYPLQQGAPKAPEDGQHGADQALQAAGQRLRRAHGRQRQRLPRRSDDRVWGLNGLLRLGKQRV
eukprot:scaffold577_cov405-Prasinococcus_capsulatus_cf.AAC.19